MTCKDCIHYEVCKVHEIATNLPWLIFTDVQGCKFFKAKSKYIDAEPVVHCKDCIHRYRDYGRYFCGVFNRNTKDTFYCGYGAKMDKEE